MTRGLGNDSLSLSLDSIWKFLGQHAFEASEYIAGCNLSLLPGLYHRNF